MGQRSWRNLVPEVKFHVWPPLEPAAVVRQVFPAAFGGLGAYAEATLEISSASSSSFVGTLGAGLTFDFSKKFQLDYGFSRGLGGRATDWVNVLRLRWSF